MDKKRMRKWVYMGFGVVVLIVAISVVFLVFEAKKSATLEILVAPLSAEIKINGKNYKNGTYKFEPEDIEVEITREGFVSQAMDFVLEPNSVVKLYTFLEPLEGNENWYSDNLDDMAIVTMIGDAKADAQSEAYTKDYPIIKILPIIYANYDESWDYTEFRIDGGSFEDCSASFCLKIVDTTGGNYARALGLIEEEGFNPEDYEILYEYKPITPLE